MHTTRLDLRRGPVCAAMLLASVGLARGEEQAAQPAPSQPAAADGTVKVDATAANTAQSSSLADSTKAPSDIRFEFNTWIWITAYTGDAGVRGRTANVDLSFKDILDDSSSIFAFSGHLEFGIGKFAVYVDGMYAHIEADNISGPRGEANINLKFDETLLDFGGMYRLCDWTPTGDAAKNPHHDTLDLYAGGRYTSLNLEIDPARVRTAARSQDWVDPIVGAKLVLPLSEHWRFSVNGDVGGFDASSQFCWSATGVFAYDFTLFNHSASVYLGYRAIGDDYTNGEGTNKFTWNIITHGPLLGFGMSF